ncbi:VOC family protein [Amycolatopsis sp. WAC 01375]|uniref:VOC family protein n=1 Tax=Amycolatopsis sp. WAC 01375 TaxID=2203194 RepID=UPI001F449EB2|nr:VOC family protein [Amycolatopsis sp. WAC 01375]
MLRLGLPVIGVSDLPRVVEFWTAALNLVADDEWASDGWRTLAGEPYPRIHLDLFVDTAAEQSRSRTS